MSGVGDDFLIAVETLAESEAMSASIESDEACQARIRILIDACKSGVELYTCLTTLLPGSGTRFGLSVTMNTSYFNKLFLNAISTSSLLLFLRFAHVGRVAETRFFVFRKLTHLFIVTDKPNLVPLPGKKVVKQVESSTPDLHASIKILILAWQASSDSIEALRASLSARVSSDIKKSSPSSDILNLLICM